MFWHYVWSQLKGFQHHIFSDVLTHFCWWLSKPVLGHSQTNDANLQRIFSLFRIFKSRDLLCDCCIFQIKQQYIFFGLSGASIIFKRFYADSYADIMVEHGSLRFYWWWTNKSENGKPKATQNVLIWCPAKKRCVFLLPSYHARHAAEPPCWQYWAFLPAVKKKNKRPRKKTVGESSKKSQYIFLKWTKHNKTIKLS